MAHAGKLKEKKGDIRLQRYFVCIFLIELTSKVFFRKTIRVVQQKQQLLL